MVLPQDDPALRLLTEENGVTLVNATMAPAAAAAVSAALVAANQQFTLVWGVNKTAGLASVSRGTPTFGAPAKFGTSSFTGGGTFTATSVCPEPVGTSVTVEAWVKRDTLPTVNSVALALGDKLWLGAAATTGYAMVCFSGDTPSRQTSTVNICDGAWHHLAFEVTRVNGFTIPKGFWVDGQPVPLTVPTVAAVWTSGLTMGGLSVTGFDWGGQVDEVRASIGTRYKAAFTPAATEGVVEQRTLVLGHMDSRTMDVATRSYPARPAGAPGGTVRYFGPFQPTDWLTDDKWEVML